MSEKWHGTTGGYSNHRCRCDDCRQAWNKSCRERKKRIRAEYVFNPDDEHGFARTYQRGCKCAACLAAHARESRTYQARKEQPPKGQRCEICGDLPKRIVWDHDHATNQFRGWLCIRCNQALGLVYDRTDILERMEGYLRG